MAGQVQGVLGRKSKPDWSTLFFRRFMITTRQRIQMGRLIFGRLFGGDFFRHKPAKVAFLEQGLTLVIPGVEAAGPFADAMRKGLIRGDVPGAVKHYFWGLPFPEGYFPNLMWIHRNKTKGAELADQIKSYQENYPGRPVHLVANSGGAGPAIFALETLPEDHPIDGLVLLGGAVSCDYDLRKALKRTRKGILNCYSHKDWLILGLCTKLLGTSDRQFKEACGFAGFKTPANLNGDTALYSKLRQIAWTPELISECDHWGTHTTCASESFVANYVAPWIKSSDGL
ncbi:MAG TPA: hypothetical protein VKJ65_03510 [Phycisphaerae bacterium]|nr:hypothetical protein [Phycisphaerae bacterium]